MTKKSFDPITYPNLKDDAERDINDFYATPEYVIDCILGSQYINYLKNLENNSRILDLGMGNGIWGYKIKQLFPNLIVDGIDVRDCNNNLYSSHYDNIFAGDFCDFNFNQKYNLIGFNPPFYLLSDYKKRTKFINKLDEIGIGDYSFIFPDSYLTGKWRYDNIWKDKLSAYMPFTARVDWTGENKPRNKHGVFVWSSKNNDNKIKMEFIDTGK